MDKFLSISILENKRIKKMTPSERVQELVGKLIFRDSFWGYLFSRVGKVESKEIEYLAVGIKEDGLLYLFYNPDIIMNSPDKDLEIVLQHEAIHILNKHISRLLKILGENKKEDKGIISQIWNYATDFNANYLINAPKSITLNNNKVDLLFATNYTDKDGIYFQNNMTSEFYYNKLVDRVNSGIGVQYIDSGISHSMWTNGIRDVSDLYSFSRHVEEATKDAVFQAYKSVRKKGNIPGNINELITECLKPPEIPYYQIIRKLVRGSKLAKDKIAYSKVNRKRGYLFLIGDKMGFPLISPFPGKVKDKTFKIAIVCDTSGSMCKEDVIESLKGCKSIIESDRNCTTTMIQVDTDIRKEYIVKRIRDIDYEICGRGGTHISPGLFRAKELDVDVTLAFTDGYCENINSIPKKLLPKKIIWVLTPNGTKDCLDKTGYIIRIKK